MELIRFRQKLEEATQGIPRKHPQAIASLSKSYPHSISLQCNPNYMDSTSDCFLYVFEQRIHPALVNKIRNIDTETSERPDFFQKLLLRHFIELHASREITDEVVVYFDGEIAKHFGIIIENDMIVSKWGIGLVWKHSVFEVPLSYGDIVKYSNGKVDNEILEELLSEI